MDAQPRTGIPRGGSGAGNVVVLLRAYSRTVLRTWPSLAGMKGRYADRGTCWETDGETEIACERELGKRVIERARERERERDRERENR